MSQPVIHLLAGQPAYWCPCCKQPHRINTDLKASPVAWSWNGDYVKPTFGPATPGSKFSILWFSDRGGYKSWRLVKPGKVGDINYRDQQAAETARTEAGLDPAVWTAKEVDVPRRRHVYCHTYVRDGMIQILPDSEGSDFRDGGTEHMKAIKGKTIPLQPWDPEKWK